MRLVPSWRQAGLSRSRIMAGFYLLGITISLE